MNTPPSSKQVLPLAKQFTGLFCSAESSRAMSPFFKQKIGTTGFEHSPLLPKQVLPLEKQFTGLFFSAESSCATSPFFQQKIGTTGFEPATPCSQSRCATKLRYVPIYCAIYLYFLGKRSLVLIESGSVSLT